MKCPRCRADNPESLKFCGECGTKLDISSPSQQAGRHPSPADRVSFTKTLEITTEELSRGTVFAGRYEVIEELGAGGMGRVYRVFDKKLDEEVALKFLRPEIGMDKRVVERFRNEIKIARKITHQNVCRTHDLGEEGKTLYITMEYVKGEDLKSLVHRTGQLTAGKAVLIARQVAEGLGQAHKLGVVHRDLKPGNIMIDKDGNAKIMDFGIARSLFGGGVTAEGAIIGTPEYMSPEQVEGKEADQRADIYALGIILFEMVTGRVPFEGETPFSIANKHKTEPPPVPKKIVPQIPEGLNKLILRCLEKDREKRYQVAEELLADLAAVEEALPQTERALTRARTKIRTSREITVKFQPRRLIIPATIVLVLAVAGFFLWRNVFHKPAAPIPSAKPTLAVLSFKNNSGDPSLDIWKDNLPTLLAAGLNQSRYLRLVDDPTVYGILKNLNLLNAEKFTPEELKNIAAQGGATHLISGNYLKAGEKLIINLSLTDAKTGAGLAPIQSEAPNHEAIYDSVDVLVKKIKSTLNVPEENIDEATYRMVGEYYTRNLEALRQFIEGQKAYYQAGDVWNASLAFRKAVEFDPDFAMAYRMLSTVQGEIEDYVGNYQNARKAFDLRNKLPEKNRLLVEAGWYMLREETHPKAIDLCRQVIKRHPEDYQARRWLAYLSPDYGERVRENGYLIQSQSQIKSFGAYRNLARAYCGIGDYKKARETYEEIIKFVPPNPLWHLNLGSLFLLERNFDAARREYEKAVAMAPDDPEVKAASVNIDWVKGDTDQALKTLNEILETQKDRSIFDDGWFPILYLEKGKFREALELIDKSEQKAISKGGSYPVFANLMKHSGIYLLQTGYAEKALEKFQGGLDYIRKIEEQIPEPGLENLMHLKRLLMIFEICSLCDMGRVKEAAAIQQELESVIPEHIPKDRKICVCMNAALSAGKIALAKKDAAAAVNKLEESRQQMPGEDYSRHDRNITNHAYLFDLLGEAYWQAGRLDKAAKAFAGIRELQNGRWEWGAVYARSYYKLGKVLEEMGKKAEAAEKYRQFLDLWKDADPGLPEVEDARRRFASLHP